MISYTHFGHFVLSTDSGEHVVLDENAVEIDRRSTLADAFTMAKSRHLRRQSQELAEQADATEAQE